ncbi:hypothetical protein Bmyc01_60050 [Bacillus mycoides]|nr:hypothetical protein Bmyc01_60050 [Bacillus mycoides]
MFHFGLSSESLSFFHLSISQLYHIKKLFYIASFYIIGITNFHTMFIHTVDLK